MSDLSGGSVDLIRTFSISAYMEMIILKISSIKDDLNYNYFNYKKRIVQLY